jgi:cytochrome c biogenesis protein CcdA
VDPVLFGEWLAEHPDLVVIEYEVFQDRENARFLSDVNTRYGCGTGVPLLFFSGSSFFVGDSSILKDVPDQINKLETNHSAHQELLIDFDSLDISTLPSVPVVWRGDRVLIRTGSGSGDAAKQLFLRRNVSAGLQAAGFGRVTPEPVSLNGIDRTFLQAAEGSGWRIQWNAEREDVPGEVSNNQSGSALETCPSSPLTLGGILMLAVTDAVNPCALAVLTLLLIAVVARNPRDRRSLLISGLLFSAAVFLLYFLYGVIILAFLKAFAPVALYRPLITRILGIGAVILGVLDIHAYRTSRNSPMTAVIPESRPLIRRMISWTVSPVRTFLAGGAVTVFLLPCTMGPYIIGCGILSPLDIPAAIPYLFLYNIIFIIPMIVVTLAVYAGVSNAEDAESWRQVNHGRMQLLAGGALLLIGSALAFGLF